MNRLSICFILCLLIINIPIARAIPVADPFEDIYVKYKWEDAMHPYTLSAEDANYSYVYIFTKQLTDVQPNDINGECRYRIIHERVKLIDEESIKYFSTLYLDGFTQTDYIRLQARVLGKDGRVTEINTGTKKFIDDNGRKSWVLNINGLEPGIELEFFYVLKMPFEISGSYWVQKDVPVKKAVFEIYSPKNLAWTSVSYNGFPATKDTMSRKIRLIKAEMLNVPAATNEYYSYYFANLMRIDYKLAYNFSFGDKELYTWNEAAKTFYKELHVYDNLDIKAIKRFVKSLNTSIDTKENIRKLEAYIKSEIHMLDNMTIEDESITNILNSKSGSRTGILQLYVLALEEMSIPYKMAYTCDRTQKNFDTTFSSWSSLDIELIYFPSQDFYICPLNYSTRMNIIPSICLNNNALFVFNAKGADGENAKAELKPIKEPFYLNSQNIIDAELDINNQIENSIIHMRMDYTGYCAEDLRYYYHSQTDENKRKSIATEQVYRQLKDTLITNVKVENFNVNSPEIYEPLEISADIVNTGIIYSKDGQYEINVGALIGDQAEWINNIPRKTPIEVLYPHKKHYTFRIDVPTGYSIKGMETLKIKKMTDTSIASSLAYFVSDYTYKDRLLEITINEVYKQGSYPISSYAAMREVINAAYYFSKITLPLQKDSK